MDARPPALGVAAAPTAPAARPEATAPAVAAPVIAAASPWPRSAQWTTAALLAAALALLGWHVCAGQRWGARPTEPDTERTDRIDLNRADRAQLLQLPGVGDVTADRIEEYRRAHNGFRSVEELRKVRGVGPALVERLRPLVEVKPEQSAVDSDEGEPAADGAPPPAMHTKGEKPAPHALKVGKTKADGPAEPINVNEASADELQQLPGIGPTLSARIIQAREQRPFRSVDELRRVKGIGVKTLESLRPFVRVD